MMRWLIILLLIVGCEGVYTPEDCAGIAGGDAVVDECGVCGGNGYNQDSIYCSDLNVIQDIIDLNESLSFITSQRWSADGRLTLLNLNDNQISHIPPSIASLTELNHLWLGNNQISEDIFQYITTLTKLTTLYLHNNSINGEIPDTFCNIYENLNYFYIGNNKLCPPYPSCFSDTPQGINVTQNSLERIIVDDAAWGFINVFNNSLHIIADGFIGGVQMTLQHGDDFTIEMTQKALNSNYLTGGNETRLLVIKPETEELFSYSGEITISEVIIANNQNSIPFEIIYYLINDGIEYQDTSNCP